MFHKFFVVNNFFSLKKRPKSEKISVFILIFLYDKYIEKFNKSKFNITVFVSLINLIFNPIQIDQQQ